jgi:hypothetical protein
MTQVLQKGYSLSDASACRGTKLQVFPVDTFNGNESDFGYRDLFAEFERNMLRLGCFETRKARQRKKREIARNVGFAYRSQIH